MSDTITSEWLVWRIVEEKGYTPDDVRNWSRIDVLKFNAILDMRSTTELVGEGYSSVKEK